MSEENLNGGCSGSCDCCSSDCESENTAGTGTVTLTMDDDTEVNCAVVTIFSAEDKEYIALLPLNEDGENEDGEVYIYRFQKDEFGNPQLENIESDDEYEIVADAFDEWLDEAQFEEEHDADCDCGCHDHEH